MPPKRTLTAKKAPADVKKVVQRDRMSVKMKNKRVPPSKQDIRKLEARKHLDDDSSDSDSSDI